MIYVFYIVFYFLLFCMLNPAECVGVQFDPKGLLGPELKQSLETLRISSISNYNKPMMQECFKIAFTQNAHITAIDDKMLASASDAARLYINQYGGFDTLSNFRDIVGSSLNCVKKVNSESVPFILDAWKHKLDIGIQHDPEIFEHEVLDLSKTEEIGAALQADISNILFR